MELKEDFIDTPNILQLSFLFFSNSKSVSFIKVFSFSSGSGRQEKVEKIVLVANFGNCSSFVNFSKANTNFWEPSSISWKDSLISWIIGLFYFVFFLLWIYSISFFSEYRISSLFCFQTKSSFMKIAGEEWGERDFWSLFSTAQES